MIAGIVEDGTDNKANLRGKGRGQMQFIREVSEGGHYDLIVCGAGPGGVGAAIAAARMNKKVLLLDCAGCVGGYWTSGLMGTSLDMPGKGGLPLEIMNELMKRNKAQWVLHLGAYDSYTYDIEEMKLLLDSLCMEAGVDVLLYARVTAVKMENGKIAAILVDGMVSHAFTADYYVDGTGHGMLSKLAGCQYEIGHPTIKKQQPGSLEAMTAGVPEELWHSDIHNYDVKQKLKKMLVDQGVSPSYTAPLLFKLSPGGVTHKLAVNHQYNVHAEDDFGMSRATMEARQEINRAVNALRSYPGWENFTLVQTAEQLGLRDGRRVHGLKTITAQDALAGRYSEDGITPVHFNLDVHKLDPNFNSAEQNWGKFQPYSVPMGCLIAKAVENLFMVGRCISGDFLALSSYRMTTTACAMGEAVAVAVSRLEKGMSTHETDGASVHDEMIRRGYEL